MAQFVLEILDGDRAGEVVTLGERPLRIGRKPQNDLVVADEKASGVHAEVVFEGQRHVLRDLGSTNGTLMDGRKITEVVLGSGDQFTIGRVRLRFRDGDAAAPAGGEGLSVARIDAARLQAARSGSRSVGLLVVVLVLALGAAGYVFWRSRAGGDDEGGGGKGKPRAELRVANNQLKQDVANCEAAAGWDLQVAGAGFHASGNAHTGTGSFEATHGAPASEPGGPGNGSGNAAGGSAPGAGADFAVAATSGELKVLAGRTVEVAAHLRTSDGAQASVRLSFWSSVDGNPFRFRTGAPLAAHDTWQRVAVATAVPPGADRCRVEVVALLPQDQSTAWLDDVALVEGGQETAVDLKVGDSATVIGAGRSIAVRSMDPEEPATLLAVLPGNVAQPFAGLRDAGELALSDVGATVAATVDEHGAVLAAQGTDALELVFPADSAGALLVDAGQGFVSKEAASTFDGQRVLLGDRSTRCMVVLAAPASLVGSVQGGRFRLQVPVPGVRLELGFREERKQARELLRTAEDAAREGRPGAALDGIRELLRTVPHDFETLGQALARRGEWQEALAARIRDLAADLEDASFFDTRGGFERVVTELDDLRTLYGEQNVEDPQALAAMRDKAATRLHELDDRSAKQRKKSLSMMADAFEKASEQGLAELVRNYVKTHLEKK
jgi:hypothetical protein